MGFQGGRWTISRSTHPFIMNGSFVKKEVRSNQVSIGVGFLEAGNVKLII
jgi:hypothetical protein